jgi:putative hydrolase of the HAD superfamily
MTLKCVMFDFGGTIADDRIVYQNIDKDHNIKFWQGLGFKGDLDDLKRARREANIEFEKIISQKNVSKTLWTKILAKKLGLDITEKDAEDDFKGFMDYYMRNVQLFPHVRETMDFIKSKKLKIVLVSNNWTEIDSILEYLDLKKYFDLVIISEDIGAFKSEELPFKIVMEKTGFRADECILVGDDLKEDAYSIKLGIKFCWFNPFGIKSEESNFDFEIKDFEKLKDIVESLL